MTEVWIEWMAKAMRWPFLGGKMNQHQSMNHIYYFLNVANEGISGMA